MTKVALDSLGCKLNQAEIELLVRQFAEVGCEVVSPAEPADIYILNTCTVTHIADRKSRHWFRLAHRRHPDARLVAIGCFAERSPAELRQIEGVDLVLGNEQKSHLVGLLEESGYLSKPSCLNPACHHHDGRRTRAFIKVQAGCRNFCAYCIVPLVRRSEQNVPSEEVLAEVRQRMTDGYQEVVLTGTEVGSYHSDGVTLRGLLERILAETDVTRVRLSSLQPPEVSPELVSLWRDKRLCPHFHLSLQSGSDGVLRRMKRRYSVAEFEQTVSLIREMAPDVAITTDVIVGFPGGTEAEFEESYEFCRRMEFARIHVFPYSLREGTKAARLPQKVADKVKKERTQKMLALAEESACNFRRRFLGRILNVLWEKRSGSTWSGLTGNYIKVYTKSSDDLTSKLLPVRLVEIRADGVWGEAIAL